MLHLIHVKIKKIKKFDKSHLASYFLLNFIVICIYIIKNLFHFLEGILLQHLLSSQRRKLQDINKYHQLLNIRKMYQIIKKYVITE